MPDEAHPSIRFLFLGASTTKDSTGTVVSVSPSFTITVTDRKGPFTYRLGQDMHIFARTTDR